MKLRLSLFLAAISIVLSALPAGTARRPRYGGILRVDIGPLLNSLDPTVPASDPETAAAKEQIDALLYDHRNSDGSFVGAVGSGPFRIAQWEPGKSLTLFANDDCPAGRPFVDSVDVHMGRAAKDRLLDLELNKVDFAEIPPEEARRAGERGVRVSISQPDELIALVFVSGRPAAENEQVREAVARSIDRSSIADFILQREGEAAGALLPQWSSGTAFLFPITADAAGAREHWSRIRGPAKILLGYDSGDALEETVAERVVVNAREVGIPLASVALSGSSVASSQFDARLVRLRMSSPRPRPALMNFLVALGPLAPVDATPLPDPSTPSQIYERERAVLSDDRIVQVVWLPEVYGLSGRVRDWKVPRAGESWPFASVWLERAEAPDSAP
jgi:peptide/nickel transport system substrate-binding protein